MALFSRKTEQKEAKVAAPAQEARANLAPGLAGVLKHARITEKASMQQQSGVYVFDVSDKATKRDIKQAVRSLYKVSPVKVAVVTVPSKARRSMKSGKYGVKSGGRKAYVYLKKGDTITIS